MEEKLVEILDRLGKLEERISALEARRVDPEVRPMPPLAPPQVRSYRSQNLPTQTTADQIAFEREFPQGLPPESAPTPSVPFANTSAQGESTASWLEDRAQKSSTDTEYFIGAKVLPFVAAILLCIGIAYLVSLGVQNGWITPTILFSGVTVLCLAFTGVGQWLRNTKEQFGDILTGIGSCGLYLNFAAGHVFQHLYKLDILVGLFLLLSGINLLYSHWRSSKAFWMIGVVGGLAGAGMPVTVDQPNVVTGLMLVIGAVAFYISGSRKWQALTAQLGLIGVVLFAPAAAYTPPGHNVMPWIVGLYGMSLFAALAYAFGSLEAESSVAYVLSAVAVIALVLKGETVGTIHTLIFGAVIIAIGCAWRKLPSANLIICAGVVIVSAIAPLGLPPLQGVIVLSVLATAFAVSSTIRFANLLANLSAAQVGLAVLSYLRTVGSISLAVELGLLVVMGVAAATVGYALLKIDHEDSLVIDLKLNCVAVAIALGIVRAAQVTAYDRFQTSVLLSICIGLLVASLALLAFGFVAKRASSAIVAIGGSFLSLTFFVIAAFEGIPSTVEMVLLGLFVAVVVGAACLAARIAESSLSPVSVAVLAVGAMFVRFSYVLFLLMKWDTHGETAIAIASAIWVLVCTLTASSKFKSLLFVGGIFQVLATSQAVMATTPLATPIPMLFPLVLALVALIGLAVRSQRLGIEESFPMWLTAAGSWILLTVIARQILPWGLEPSTTAAWIVTVIGLLVSGFFFDLKTLRFASFVVIAATIGKVLLIDLAGTSQVIKILILMALGLAMLAGGYVYIRRKQPSS